MTIRRERRRLLALGVATLGAAVLRPAANAQAGPPAEEGDTSVTRVEAGASIQAAIDRTPAGGRVEVGAGTFHETLRIEKPLTLRGAGYRNTVVRADRSRIVWSGLPRERYLVGAVNVRNTRDVDIAGFTFQDALEGVWVSASQGVRVHDCMSCEHDSSGYYLWACVDCTVSRCEALDCAVGFYQGNSVDIDVLRNTFHHNRGGPVPHLDDDVYPGIGVLLGNLSRGCRVEGNELRDNVDWGAGISLGVTGVTLVGNALRDNAVGVFVGEQGLRMHHNNVTGNARWGVDSEVAVAASGNWWGAPDGPGGAGPGQGDAVRAPVEVRPWRREPVRVPPFGPRSPVPGG